MPTWFSINSLFIPLDSKPCGAVERASSYKLQDLHAVIAIAVATPIAETTHTAVAWTANPYWSMGLIVKGEPLEITLSAAHGFNLLVRITRREEDSTQCKSYTN